MEFEIDFSPRARANLKRLRKPDQQMILDTISQQLPHQPDHSTRHRKRLEENPLAPWELRVGNWRVFYDVDAGKKLVAVLAIGYRVHNVLKIGDEEITI